MYSIALHLKFRAEHFLIGGDWGAENQLHHHDYLIEWTLSGDELDKHGYLIDLLAVEAELGAVVATVKDKTLNDLPAFRGLNPSVERLARQLSDQLMAGRNRWDEEQRLSASQVKVWENDTAWAAWTAVLFTPPRRF